MDSDVQNLSHVSCTRR